MGKLRNNITAQYVLILCLSAALLFMQSFKLHIHIQHDDVALSTAAEGYSVDLHVAFPPHDTSYLGHHQDDLQDHHHPVEVDVSASNFVKKMGLSNSFILVFFILSIILCTTPLCRIHRKHDFKTECPANYYLLLPFLRAPPVK